MLVGLRRQLDGARPAAWTLRGLPRLGRFAEGLNDCPEAEPSTCRPTFDVEFVRAATPAVGPVTPPAA